MKHKVLLTLLLISFIGLSQESGSQINPPQLPNIVPPSPSVANLMRFDELPVNYYTGQPDINIPLLNAEGKNISIPISLSYSTLGNRVDERSGTVGTGWSISGDIVISRTIMGIRDDKFPTEPPFNYGIYNDGYESFDINNFNYLEFSAQNKGSKSLENFLWNTAGLGSSNTAMYSGSSNQYLNGGFDSEYDMFHLSLNGVNAKFIIVKDYNGYNIEYLKNDHNVVLEVTFSNGEIDSFIVTDNVGRKYILDQKETTSTVSHNASVPQGDNVQPNLGGQQITDTYVSAWKVSEIFNYTNKKIAKFHYVDVNEALSMARNITKYEIPEISKKAIYDEYLRDRAVEVGYDVYNKRVLKPLISYSFNETSIETKKISCIELLDSSNIFFYYSSYHPEYEGQTGARLESVVKTKIIQDITNQEEINLKKIKTVKLKYDIINCINTSNFVQNFSRLYLNSVEQHRPNDSLIQKHTIKYNGYLTEGFGSTNKDYWGFYKKPFNLNTPQIFKTDGSTADVENVTKGLIEHIIYPNGGVKEFTFESNTIYHMGSRELTLDEYKKKNPNNWIKHTINLNNSGTLPSQETIFVNEQTEFTISSTATYNDSPGPGDIGIFGPSDDDSSGAGSEDADYSGNVDSGTPGLTLFQIMKIENNQEIHIGAVHFDYDSTEYQNLILEPGTYVFRFDPNSQTTAQQSVNIYGLSYKSVLDKEIPGGGVRIRDVKYFDNESSNKAEYHKHYDYRPSYLPEVINNENINYPQENSPTAYSLRKSSSGVTDGFHTNFKKYNRYLSHQLATLAEDTGNTLVIENEEVGISYKVTEYLNSVYASLTQNSYVGYEKVWVTNLNGSVESYTYSSPNGNNTYDANYVFPFLPNQDKSIYQGLLQKQQSFNHQMKILNKTNYDYQIAQNRVGVSLFTFQEQNCVWNQFYREFEDYINQTPEPDDTYWDPSNNSNFYVNCAPMNSYYSSIGFRFKEHFLEKVLQKEVVTTNYFYDSDDNLSHTVTSTSNNEYWPITYQIKSSTKEVYNSSNNSTELIKQKMYYPYNLPPWYSWNTQELINANRIAEPTAIETFNNDVLTSRLAKVYDFVSDNSPFEPIINSTNTANNPLFELSQTYFAKGNENLDLKLKFELYDDDANVLQVRQTNGTPVSYIYGYNQTKPIAKLVNFEYNNLTTPLITNIQTASNNDANCTSNCIQTEEYLRNTLDQLRSYPNTQVTTYTYDPLIGVTSMTDPRGQTIYYNYDSFNRLKNIKDSSGNIIEAYDYNYRQSSNE